MDRHSQQSQARGSHPAFKAGPQLVSQTLGFYRAPTFPNSEEGLTLFHVCTKLMADASDLSFFSRLRSAGTC